MQKSCETCTTVAALISILLQYRISLQVLSFIAAPCCLLQLVLLGARNDQFRTGFCFTADVFFFRHSFSEVHLPIELKLCHVVGIWLNFIIPLQKIGGGAPLKNLGAKNMQNFGHFWTTSEFDREYFRNEATYPKSERSKN